MAFSASADCGPKRGSILIKCASAVALMFLSACGAISSNQVEPQWIEQPTADAIRRYYPEAANAQQVVGTVRLDCVVSIEGHPTCAVVDETPVGWDFGDAALALSTTFQMRAGTIDGEPAELHKNVRIRFAFPTETEPTAEEREYMEHVPQPDLPSWDLAPTAFDVAAAYPADAVGHVERARAVLQCRVNLNRTLACEPLTATPADMGFAEAAMRLSARFRIAESSAEFAQAHQTDTFLLPVNFGASSTQEPLSTFFSGAGPVLFDEPPPEVIRQIYPARAAASGIEGRASVLCTLRAGQAATCALESESPAGWGFGEAARTAARQLNFRLDNAGAEQMGMLEGDQIRVPFNFRLPE